MNSLLDMTCNEKSLILNSVELVSKTNLPYILEIGNDVHFMTYISMMYMKYTFLQRSAAHLYVIVP